MNDSDIKLYNMLQTHALNIFYFLILFNLI